MENLATAPLDRYTYFAECILAAEGENHLISTNTIVYDVRLDLGFLESNGNFISTATVFAANSLCSDQAIRLCWTPDSQQLLLRGTIDGTEKAFLLTVNTDGTVSLSPL